MIIRSSDIESEMHAEITDVLATTWQGDDEETDIASHLATIGISPLELFQGQGSGLSSNIMHPFRIVERASGPISAFQNKFSSREKLLIAEQLAAQTERLHEQGYAHLDLRCDNIVIKIRGAEKQELGCIKLIDFGSTMSIEYLEEAKNRIEKEFKNNKYSEDSWGRYHNKESAFYSVLMLRQRLQESNTFYEAPEIGALIDIPLPCSLETAAQANRMLHQADIRRSDTWSLGLIFLELAQDSTLDLSQLPAKTDQEVIDLIADTVNKIIGKPFYTSNLPRSRETLTLTVKQALQDGLIDRDTVQLILLANKCLHVDPTLRISIQELAEELGGLCAITL